MSSYTKFGGGRNVQTNAARSPSCALTRFRCICQRAMWSPAAEAALTEGLYAVPIFIGSSLTLIGCAITLLTYYKYEELRRHPNGIVTTKTFFDAAFAITMITEQAVRVGGKEFSADCRGYSFFIELTIIGSELCFGLLGYDLYVALKNPFVNYKSNLKKYIVFVFLFAVVMAAILVGSGPDVYGMTNFGQCWIKPVFAPVSGYMWAFFYWLLIAVFAFSIFVMIYARRRLTKGLRETYEARQASFSHGLAFVVVYGMYWLVVAIVYWISLPNDTTPDISNAAWVFCLFFSARGLVTMACWLYNHNLRVIAAQDKQVRASGGTLGKVNRQLQPHLNLALRKEVLHYTTLALRLSIMEAVGEGQMITMVNSMKRQLRATKADLVRKHLDSNGDVIIGGGKAGANDVTSPVITLPGDDFDPDAIIARCNQHAPWNERDANRSDHDISLDWTPLNIALKAPLFERNGQFDIGEYTTPNILMVKRTATPVKSSLTSPTSVDNPMLKIHIDGDADLNPTPTSAQEGGIIKRPPLELHDLAPQAFGRIRDLFGVTPAQFFYSLSRTTKERFSEGASGAFICFSHDMKFVIKTMEKDEAEVLKRILPEYLEYLRQNRDSLIIKFYACMSLRLYSQTLYFVVMENIFPTRSTIHERFDLKGSWVGRSASKGMPGTLAYCRFCNESFKVGSSDTCKARPNRPHTANTVLKDNDLNYKLRLQPEKASRLGAQLRADTAFLARMGVMDYSLLIGVHNRKFRIDEPANNTINNAASQKAKWQAVQQYYAQKDVPPPPPGRSATVRFNESDNVHSPGTDTVIDHVISADEEASLSSENEEDDAFRPQHVSAGRPPHVVNSNPMYSVRKERVQTEKLRLKETRSFVDGAGALPPQRTKSNRRQSAAITLGAAGYTPFFRSDEGGVSSAIIEGPGVFYMGIIDILQEWSLIKRAERWFKRYFMFQDPRGMSVMPPPDYAERFESRVIAAIIEQDTHKMPVTASLPPDRRMSMAPRAFSSRPVARSASVR